jgi:hypothetical protein
MTLAPLPSIYSATSLREFLGKKLPNDKVGHARRSGACTLKEWLEAIFWARAVITDHFIEIDGKMYGHAEWSKGFMQGIDRSRGKGVVRAKDAIEILDGVLASKEERVA